MEIAAEFSPLTVLTRGVLEWACPDTFFLHTLDRTCRPHRWTRKFAIDATTLLILLVGEEGDDQAVESPTITATTSTTSDLSAKYGRLDLAYALDLVRGSARRLGPLMEAAGARYLPGWEGGWLKENRRVGTRQEKLTVNYLARVNLAMIRRDLRILESPNRV